MELFEILPHKLYQSGQIDDWDSLRSSHVDLVIDLATIDSNVPDWLNYAHHGIEDSSILPDMKIMKSFAELGAEFIDDGMIVLSHCGAGINRSSLMSGMILHQLMVVDGPGSNIVDLIRKQRPGALSNLVFAHYLEGLQ